MTTNSSKKVVIKPMNSSHSNHELVFIAVDSRIKLTDEQINSAMELLQKEYPMNEIVGETFDSVEFVDPGQNLSTISCNLCSKQMTIEYWQQVITESYNCSHFWNLDFQTKCCHKETNLNNLIYDSDCGFGMFQLYVNDAEYYPERAKILNENISKYLGIPLKFFWRQI